MLNSKTEVLEILRTPWSFLRKQESGVFHPIANTLDPGFHRGDEYSLV